MELAQQIEELKRIFSGVMVATECNTPFYLIPKIALPDHCNPKVVDGLLCPVEKDNYQTRLYYSQRIDRPPPPAPKKPLNWTGQIRLLEKNWFVLSWQIPDGTKQRLVQMVLSHLEAFQ
jgi:hypothetical protein